MFYLIAATILASLLSVWVFIRFFKKGCFQDMEETKYQVFRDENETSE
ncbi:Uncharacterized protein AB751O23_AN_00020 [Chlamydiales bacterium SCGC AB-751-O23]|nr:Uncharacterized protein AB751O23_AN_00020 [Chlamydiales bacterium SCGC AB-751-O23]